MVQQVPDCFTSGLGVCLVEFVLSATGVCVVGLGDWCISLSVLLAENKLP